MHQILTGITAFFASLLALVGLSGQPAMTQVTPPPTEMVATMTPSSTQQVIFKGVSPCADCPGIDTTLTLNYDGSDNVSGTFSEKMVYQDRNAVPALTYQGTWKGLPNDIIELTPTGANAQKQYFLQSHPNTLEALGADMTELPAPYNYELTAGN